MATPPTLLDRLEAGEFTADALPRPSRERGGCSAEARCECGRFVPLALLVDVRTLAPSGAPEIAARQWACDACWSDWLRTGAIDRAQWLAGTAG